MTEKRTFVIHAPEDRHTAAKAMLAAPMGTAIVVRPATRSDEQNRLFHALCSELSKGVKRDGAMLPAAKWKEALISSLWGFDMIPSLDGEGGVIPVRRSSATLGVKLMSELIEFTYMVGARHDYVFNDPRPGDERNAA